MQQIGSKWWKFDFHTHTPASMDYGKDDHQIKHTMTARQWLLDYISHGIECIAVTDHNSGAWVDLLKSEAENLRAEGHSIYIFPGVEVTAHGNIHVLGIFDPDKTSSYISQIIGAANYSGTEGDSDAVTQSSPQDVIDMIISRGGVAIPAHMDKPSGLCTVHSSGATLKQILTNASAVEIIKTHDEYENIQQGSSPLKGYVALKTALPEVIGSDSHHPNTVGRAFTWVKMGIPSIDGLRLALFDGSGSLRRSDQFPNSPNIYAENRITSIKISKTKYCGRVNEFSINFHPWLNCIIGGRGSGKSTILEFIRTALGRESELEQLSSNKEMYNSYLNLAKKAKTRDDDGVFLDGSVIKIEYLKGENKYSLEWEYDGDIKIKRFDGDNIIYEEGDITSRFPVKIFSQKQIYEISRSPNYLLNLIDESSIVDIKNWKYEWDTEVNTLSQLRRDSKELRASILTKSSLTGQLNDINLKIASIERSSHATILSNYQRALSQLSVINNFSSQNKAFLEGLVEYIQLTRPAGIIANNQLFNTPNEIETESKALLLQQKIVDAITLFSGTVESIVKDIDDLTTWFNSCSLNKEISHNKTQYSNLVSTLQASGVNNPNEYESLIASRKQLTDRLKKK